MFRDGVPADADRDEDKRAPDLIHWSVIKGVEVMADDETLRPEP